MNNVQTANPLGHERVGKLLARYAIPSIISLIINSLYNMVDQIFIGQGVGFLGNGATNIIAPIATIAISVAALFGDGLAVLGAGVDAMDANRKRRLRESGMRSPHPL